MPTKAASGASARKIETIGTESLVVAAEVVIVDPFPGRAKPHRSLRVTSSRIRQSRSQEGGSPPPSRPLPHPGVADWRNPPIAVLSYM